MTLQEPKTRVLVVDDNADAADALASLLTLFDCTVRVAYSGIEALSAGDLLFPHLVVLDISMPGLDGHDTARQMRARAWGQHACIAALTAHGDDDTRAGTVEAGMNFCFLKPISADTLLAVLAGVRQ
jgi:CheY-like chemotaxis protein